MDGAAFGGFLGVNHSWVRSINPTEKVNSPIHPCLCILLWWGRLRVQVHVHQMTRVHVAIILLALSGCTLDSWKAIESWFDGDNHESSGNCPRVHWCKSRYCYSFTKPRHRLDSKHGNTPEVVGEAHRLQLESKQSCRFFACAISYFYYFYVPKRTIWLPIKETSVL